MFDSGETRALLQQALEVAEREGRARVRISFREPFVVPTAWWDANTELRGRAKEELRLQIEAKHPELSGILAAGEGFRPHPNALVATLTVGEIASVAHRPGVFYVDLQKS